ncbi:SusC/RagA family TonB-linked outer membrane protein [Pedobacter nyackensis]|uniref:TonB-linked outer membrane protein, SusC/RagA family n=1 Tax=Pedobacter nyackensis TaxID=475255 RepID=A0A1W2AAI6_9SPHI|nr:TonB-dependent receptor [Pedobacter nyackensis]SMC57735.1 TonB-linked outer membrane protein, SusC/RagA family [Pedobacter nyackensis]
MKIKNTIVILLLTFFSPLIAASQEKGVHGQVKSSKGETIPNITVKLKGTNTLTRTDMDGKFNLNVAAAQNGILIFSGVSWTTQEVAVNGKRQINIVLQESTSELDGVVVIGYGTKLRKDLTGAVASIPPKAIKEMPVVSAEQALQGRLSGVQVIQTNSAPGGAISIRIRGGNSALGGNEPLYVIDGFPVYSNVGTNDGKTQAQNPLASINPNDIASMEVLKDASATAIYGARGANGVVIITTNRGKAGKAKLNFESNFGIQTIRHKIPMLNGKEYMYIANTRAKNLGTSLPYPDASLWTSNNDWQDLIMRDAPFNNYSLSASGGNENNQYNISGNWADQSGIVRNSGFKRGAIRINLDNKINAKLKLSTSITASKTDNQQARTSLDIYGGIVYVGLVAPPIAPIYKEDGSYYKLGNIPTADPAWDNPIALLKGYQYNVGVNRFLGNSNLTYSIIDGLSLSVRVGIDNQDVRTDRYVGRDVIGSPGSASIANSNAVSYLNENILNYATQFGDKHKFDVTTGFTFQEDIGLSVLASSQNFDTDIYGTNNLGAGSVSGSPTSGKSKNTLLSFLGRANYSYDSKYYLTVSARSDGSSRFGFGNKWGFFPSAALAWRLSAEDFLKEVSWVSDFKLRASVGKTGNQEIGNYNSLARLSSIRTIFGADQSSVIGYAMTNMPNSQLKWETTTQYDAGIELSLFNSRLSILVDYYVKHTNDLLANIPVPLSTGFGGLLVNSGSIRNKGFEFSADATVIKKDDFKWDVRANFSKNVGKVHEVALSSGQFFGGNIFSPIDASVNIIKEGYPLSSFYGYVTDGLWDANQATGSIMPNAKAGDQRYKDLNGDGRITADDRMVLGQPDPKMLYGLSSTLAYKNFEFNFLLYGAYGAKVFNANKFSIGDAFARGANQMKEVLDFWTPENLDAKYPRPSNVNPLVSDRFFEDASFLRLRNVQLNYNFPEKTFGINWLSSLSIYVSAQNLLTWTKYSGFDPEVSSTGGSDLRKGIDVGAYPAAKTFSAGLRFGL